MSDLQEFSKNAAREVEAVLDQLLPKASAEPKWLHEAMRWSTFAGGKRFRPLLVFAVSAMFDVTKKRIE